MKIDITYEILGKPITLENGEQDGNEELGSFTHEHIVNAIDIIEFYGLDDTKEAENIINELWLNGVFDFLEDDNDFYDFLKEQDEDEARENYEENKNEREKQ